MSITPRGRISAGAAIVTLAGATSLAAAPQAALAAGPDAGGIRFGSALTPTEQQRLVTLTPAELTSLRTIAQRLATAVPASPAHTFNINNRPK